MASVSNSDFKDYLQTILWSCTDNSDEKGGEPLDKNYDVDDFNSTDTEIARKECERFVKENEEIVDSLLEDSHSMGKILHDFWLTRNRHGSGFWDQDYPDVIGKKLTESAHRYGEKTPYIGDDNIIYIM